MTASKSKKVPSLMKDKYDEIVALTDEYSAKYLTDEYAEYCQILAASLARKRQSPIIKGKPNVWACGIIHAVGLVNFLFDKETKPFVRAAELYAYFKISSSTGSAKSKFIRDMYDMFPSDPNWTLPSRLESNPLVWTLSVNGMIVDIRDMPIEAQEQAYEMGLIPYVPS